MKHIKAGVIGATGYTGAELVRLLSCHPNVSLAAVSSVSYEGQRISDIYPNLYGICDLTLSAAGDVITGCDAVFAALPHGLSEEIAANCKDAVFIDLGADFRIADESVYKTWYGKPFLHPGLHGSAVYSIPELHRSEIRDAGIIANPGCYPTASALGLAPAIEGGLIETEGIIIDSKSGVTGAGRGLTQNTHFPDTNEAFSAYKAGVHRHTPEIEQQLSRLAGTDVKVTFIPHLLPVNRGIESTIYCRLKKGVSYKTARLAYENAYKNERFVRIMPQEVYANIKNVRMSNYCDISLHTDAHTGMLIICACIDNMVKGAAGQAIQNMNIRFGFDESAGLLAAPPAF
jgi:N-acetyl-gamma-glutamyl-phosphate reductase